MESLTEKQLKTGVYDQDGKVTKLGEYLSGEKTSGQKPRFLVLYFYPKDNTPGCTTEACSFRDSEKEMKKLGGVVLGVSKDSVSSHQKFKEKYHLSFELLSDPEHKLLETFGAWGEKKFMGKIFMGVLRQTFLIDQDGTILKVWRQVKPLGHAEEVLAAAKQLLSV